MTFRSSRDIPAAPTDVFAAFADAARLAVWWGPAGFTNTFQTFEFAPGGRWSFTMHGPDGKNYSNEIVVTEMDPPRRIVLHHVSPPRYRLTVSLEQTPNGTRVDWHQAFENPDVGLRLAKIIAPANEQLLDRWTAEVLRTSGR